MPTNSVEDKIHRIKIFGVISAALLALGKSVSSVVLTGLDPKYTVGIDAILNIAVVSGFFYIVIDVIDRLRKETKTLHADTLEEIAKLNLRMKDNFEYHGIIDSPKTKYSKSDMHQIWPILMERVKSDFSAVNYLSAAVWKENNGDNLVITLGSRRKTYGYSARRIFVFDTDDEVNEWRNTINIHTDFGIEAKCILKCDYDELRKDYFHCADGSMGVCGFNVIDSERPGISVIWEYDRNRGTNGAELKRGEESARSYLRFFNRIWGCEAKCRKMDVQRLIPSPPQGLYQNA